MSELSTFGWKEAWRDVVAGLERGAAIASLTTILPTLSILLWKVSWLLVSVRKLPSAGFLAKRMRLLRL